MESNMRVHLVRRYLGVDARAAPAGIAQQARAGLLHRRRRRHDGRKASRTVGLTSAWATASRSTIPARQGKQPPVAALPAPGGPPGRRRRTVRRAGAGDGGRSGRAAWSFCSPMRSTIPAALHSALKNLRVRQQDVTADPDSARPQRARLPLRPHDRVPPSRDAATAGRRPAVLRANYLTRLARPPRRRSRATRQKAQADYLRLDNDDDLGGCWRCTSSAACCEEGATECGPWYPLDALGLAGLAVPVIIHLIQRQRLEARRQLATMQFLDREQDVRQRLRPGAARLCSSLLLRLAAARPVRAADEPGWWSAAAIRRPAHDGGRARSGR